MSWELWTLPTGHAGSVHVGDVAAHWKLPSALEGCRRRETEPPWDPRRRYWARSACRVRLSQWLLAEEREEHHPRP